MYWTYLIKASISFSILYTFYWIFLRHTTFHTFNRIILLFILFFSLLIPKITLTSLESPFIDSNIVEFTIGELNELIASSTTIQPTNDQKSIYNSNFLILIYWIGVSFFISRFFIQLFKLIKFRINHTNKKLGKFRYIFPNRNIAPFSFFYWIFIPFETYSDSSSKSIIEHEKTHAKQFHTFDILISELFAVFFWFVPFVHFYKQTLKNVHEYLADHIFSESPEFKISYLKILSQETEKYTLSGITSSFYSKTLKSRIAMISKKKTPKQAWFMYLLIIPLFGILSMSFGKSSFFENPIIKESVSIKELNKSEIKFIQPIDKNKCRISSGFGERMHPIKKELMQHNGIDYAAKKGTPIFASSAGKIIRKEFKENGYGNVIAIQHQDGYLTLYAQLSEFKIEIGQQIKQGEIIGLVGSSGISTGPHLHFELRKDGEYLNPENFIN